MYQQLLLAYDGSEQGQNAILQCAEISQWTGATVTLVAIMPREMVFAAPEGGFYSPEQHAFEKQKYKLILDQGLRILGESGHVAEGVVLQGETIHEISKHARKVGADLIVIGHKHEKNWAARWWRGTSASSLIEHAPCSVLMVITPWSARPDERGWAACLNLCMEAKRPVMMFVGMSAGGAGTRGGMGMVLEDCHPRYVNRVAARYPDLNVIAAGVAWPWQSEMIAVALHKANVWMELHGWSPRYYYDELKWEIGKRLRKKVFFAADYPMLGHERLVSEASHRTFLTTCSPAMPGRFLRR